jgi:hypothetical protein
VCSLRTCTLSGRSEQWRRTSGAFENPSSTLGVPEKPQSFPQYNWRSAYGTRTSENTSLPLYVSSEVHILDDAQGG